MANLGQVVTDSLAPAFEQIAGHTTDPVVRRSQFADFQADGALALARSLGRSPRDIAAEIVQAASLDDIASSVEITGPGFINVTLRDEFIATTAGATAADDRLGVPEAEHPDRVVIDYSAPNAAKEMHVGHLRSTIIGDAVVRLLEWRGHTVIRQNHIGEWGTPFGMLIEHLLDVGEETAAHELSVGDLDTFYKAARKKFDGDPAFADRARARVVLLQSGDELTMRLWRILVEQSKEYFLTVYERLGVLLTPDDFYGESAYNDVLGDVVQELDEKGLLQISKGAKCVFPAGYKNREGEPLPLIVMKSDGGFGYDVTDLAAIRHRTQNLKATRVLYVVGLPQAQHLQMVFQAGRDAGWVGPDVEVTHVGHGSILGEDGTPLKSRAGQSVKLIDLLDEAVVRATAAVETKNPGLDTQRAAEVAQAVGIGAVKYSDLSTDRNKDYRFSYDRALAFEGNTAPYLQYAHARIHSILRKAGQDLAADHGPIHLTEPAERGLALELLAFEPVTTEVERSLELHKLTAYLYELASAFTTFYENCPVLRSEGEVQRTRLALCALTARTLERGLNLLGIDAPTEM